MLITIEFTAEERAARSPASEKVTRAATALRTHGCVFLRDVLPAPFVAALRDAFLARQSDQLQAALRDEAGGVGHKRFQVPLDLSGPFNDPQLYANPFVLPILRAVLGEELVLGGCGTVTSLPGATDQHVHRDGPPLFNKVVNRMVPAHAVDLFVPLIELNEHTGSTRLFPDTHINTDLDPATATFVDPVIPVGSCLLIDYRLYHQGRANRSDQIRPLLYCVYHQPWFKDYKNHATTAFFRLSDAERAKIQPEHRGLFAWTEHYRGGLY